MLSAYFKKKISNDLFVKTIEGKVNKLSGKKVLVYGAGEGFKFLYKSYFSNLDIVAIADKKFEEENPEKLFNIKTIMPEDIDEIKFDFVLVSLERPVGVLKYLKAKCEIPDEKIVSVFEEEIEEESISYCYLEQLKFNKRLNKLNKKLKNKTSVIYGAGVFFETIKKYYDLSNLNIIAVSDKKFEDGMATTFKGYKAIKPSEIIDLNPDYVLVATKFYVNIIQDLYYKTLKDSNIKIKPLIKKSFLTLLKEIWNNY